MFMMYLAGLIILQILLRLPLTHQYSTFPACFYLLVKGKGHNRCSNCRYVFSDEAVASASADGRSSEYVVARSEEDAHQQAQSRYAFAASLFGMPDDSAAVVMSTESGAFKAQHHTARAVAVSREQQCCGLS